MWLLRSGSKGIPSRRTIAATFNRTCWILGMSEEVLKPAAAAVGETLLARLPRQALLLFVFLLPFMQPSFRLLRFDVVGADVAYLLLIALWGLGLLTGAAKLR